MESLKIMFEDFYTVYSMATPPEIYKDNPSLIRDIENPDITKYSIATPTMDIYPEITSPSDNQVGTPLKKFTMIYNETPNVIDHNTTHKVSNISQSFKSNKDFVNVLDQAYKNALSKAGLDPNFSTMLVALDALETGYGKSVKGNFNYGNITTIGSDWHVRTGKRKWKDFSSIEDYVNYKIKFLSKKRYRFFDTFTSGSNVGVAMQTLANRGYDPGNPDYGNRVRKVYNNIIQKYLS